MSLSKAYRNDIILDRKIVEVVNAQGSWMPAFKPSTGSKDNAGPFEMEQSKIQKRAPIYANIGYAFLPFVGYSIGGFG